MPAVDSVVCRDLCVTSMSSANRRQSTSLPCTEILNLPRFLLLPVHNSLEKGNEDYERNRIPLLCSNWLCLRELFANILSYSNCSFRLCSAASWLTLIYTIWRQNSLNDASVQCSLTMNETILHFFDFSLLLFLQQDKDLLNCTFVFSESCLLLSYKWFDLWLQSFQYHCNHDFTHMTHEWCLVHWGFLCQILLFHNHNNKQLKRGRIY